MIEQAIEIMPENFEILFLSLHHYYSKIFSWLNSWAHNEFEGIIRTEKL